MSLRLPLHIFPGLFSALLIQLNNLLVSAYVTQTFPNILCNLICFPWDDNEKIQAQEGYYRCSSALINI